MKKVVRVATGLAVLSIAVVLSGCFLFGVTETWTVSGTIDLTLSTS